MSEPVDPADVQALLRQLLPEVSMESLQIQSDMEKEYSQKFRVQSEKMLAEQLEQMEQQAEEEYREVLALIHREKQSAMAVRFSELDQQQCHYQVLTRQAIERQREKKLQEYQQQYLLQNFQSEVMGHPYFCQMRSKIERELTEKFEQRFALELTRKEKQLLVKLKQKQDKQFEDLQLQYREECSSLVQEMQQRVDTAKVELARLRSQSNVKVKKIQAEKKQFEEKLRKDSVNYQKIIDSLEGELLALETNKLRRTDNEPQLTGSYRNYYDLQSLEEDESSPGRSPPQEQEEQHRVDIPEKMVQSSSSDSEDQLAEPEDLKLERPARHRILNKNPRSYLQFFLPGENSSDNLPRSNVNQSDTFQKDLSKYLPTQADAYRKYQPSNFREEYEKQLRRMDCRRTKLSAAAKNIIVHNIMKEVGGRKRNTSIFSSIR